MNWVALAAVFVYVILLMVRSLRWIAVVQQKEYRLDRIWGFLNSVEGLADLLRLVPAVGEFSRTGLKRPRLTMRSLVSMVVFGLEVGALVSAGVWWYLAQQFSPVPAVVFAVWLVLVLASVPFLAILTAVPTSIIARYQTHRMSMKAARMLAASDPLIIGITGSYGKSSTKQLLAHVLSKKYSVFATPRSFNTRYSVAQSIVTGYTGQKIVILEYGAYGPGEIKRLATDLHPNWAIITGFSPQHIGLFGSEDAIVRAKAELLLALPKDGKAFTNGDDRGVQRILTEAQKRRTIDVVECLTTEVSWLKKAKLSDEGAVELTYEGKSIITKLIGRQYLQTVASVSCVAQALGVVESAVVKQLATFQPSDTFMLAETTQSGVRILDDGGTSNPKGFTAALALLAELEYPQKVLITPGIVDLGAQSESIHRDLAEQAWDAGVSEVMYVGSDGKSAFTTVFGANRVLSEPVAVEATLKSLHAGSILLIEGRMPGWCDRLLTAAKSL